MDHLEACTQLPGLVATYADTVRGADMGAPVPTCPRWDLAKLTKHVGTIHRWATAMVQTRATERLDQRTLDLGLPADPSGYAEWIVRGGDELVATLRDADPDDAMWAWGADQHVRFWSRRMVHEIGVHTADAQFALGRQPRMTPDLAVDAVDELLDNLPCAAYFAPNVENLRGDGTSIHVHCNDVEGEWMIELDPDGFRWSHAHGKGTVAVRGNAGDLALLLYRRRDLDDVDADGAARFTLFGERAVLADWLANSAL
jgi:uncharacterized protein (TIGR03083 family)